MSYIIPDKSSLDGTAYIEIYPGNFDVDRSHWNENSIFFKEHNWELFIKIVQRHFPDYDPYGLQVLNRNIWSSIIKDLETLSNRIGNGEKVSSIRSEILFLSDYSENEFMKDETHSLNTLRTTIDEFVNWIQESLTHSGVVSILGL